MGCNVSRVAPGEENTIKVEYTKVEYIATSSVSEANDLEVGPTPLALEEVEEDGYRRAALLRSRLASIGCSASIELSPAQVRGGKVSLHSAYESAAAAGAGPPLREGTQVFVNMVKKDSAHFADVTEACAALSARGLRPTPHVPTCRFSACSEADDVLDRLCDVGCESAFVPGGNDQHERGLVGAFGSVGAAFDAGMLVTPTAQPTMRRVLLAGHPEGHPGLGRCPEKTMAVLLEKAERLMAGGRSVGVASQICFDAELAVEWIERTRTKLHALAVRYAVPPPVMHVGVPGPTKASRLKRIAEMCEVSSLFIGSAFERIDADADGLVSRAELLAAAPYLHADAATLEMLFSRHAGRDGMLQRYELAEVLADLGDETAHVSPHASPHGARAGKAHSVAGPSTQVQARRASKEPAEEDPLVLPEELVLALAAYVEREQLPEGEVVLHLYPFGGVDRSLQLLRDMAEGAWPAVEFH